MGRKPCFRRPLFTLEWHETEWQDKSYFIVECESSIWDFSWLSWLVRLVNVAWWTFIWSLKNDRFRSKIDYFYCKIGNRVWTSKKPGFVGSNSVGSYGFSCRRKTGGHALVNTYGDKLSFAQPLCMWMNISCSCMNLIPNIYLPSNVQHILTWFYPYSANLWWKSYWATMYGEWKFESFRATN